MLLLRVPAAIMLQNQPRTRRTQKHANKKETLPGFDARSVLSLLLVLVIGPWVFLRVLRFSSFRKNLKRGRGNLQNAERRTSHFTPPTTV